jgi:hypothetical protein
MLWLPPHSAKPIPHGPPALLAVTSGATVNQRLDGPVGLAVTRSFCDVCCGKHPVTWQHHLLHIHCVCVDRENNRFLHTLMKLKLK